jgi:multidrug resistance efflux pump
MARWFAFSCAVVCLTAALGTEELPKHDSDESFEVEPPLLIPNRSNKSLPDAITAGKPASNLDPDRLEKELERAKKNAAGAERLFKIGVLAKVEVEQQALRVVRLQSGLENARLAQAKRELAQQEQRLAAGEISKADLFQAEVTLARAIEAAHAAAERRESAELEAAELNLRRQQKLLALGSGRKSEVARAEQKLAELKAPKE